MILQRLVDQVGVSLEFIFCARARPVELEHLPVVVGGWRLIRQRCAWLDW